MSFYTVTKTIFSTRGCFFSLTWAENEHWQPLVALRPLEAVKSFISCPCDTGKQPLIPKIVSDTGKMTNEWSKVLIPMYFSSERWHYNLFFHDFSIIRYHNEVVVYFLETFGNFWKLLEQFGKMAGNLKLNLNRVLIWVRFEDIHRHSGLII